MNIKNDLTVPECERYRRDGNFTDEELFVFNHRVRGHSVVQISMEGNMSTRTVDRRLRSIKAKIDKLI